MITAGGGARSVPGPDRWSSANWYTARVTASGAWTGVMCPTSGSSTSPRPHGSNDANRFECQGGVNRSALPTSTSVGTSRNFTSGERSSPCSSWATQ